MRDYTKSPLQSAVCFYVPEEREREYKNLLDAYDRAVSKCPSVSDWVSLGCRIGFTKPASPFSETITVVGD